MTLRHADRHFVQAAPAPLVDAFRASVLLPLDRDRYRRYRSHACSASSDLSD